MQKERVFFFLFVENKEAVFLGEREPCTGGTACKDLCLNCFMSFCPFVEIGECA